MSQKKEKGLLDAVAEAAGGTADLLGEVGADDLKARLEAAVKKTRQIAEKGRKLNEQMGEVGRRVVPVGHKLKALFSKIVTVEKREFP